MAWHGPPSGAGDEDEILGKAYDGRLMRRLLPYLKPYRRVMSFALIILLGSSLLDLAGPLLTGIAIDDYIAPSHGKPHIGGLPLILALYVGSLVAGFVLKYTMNYMLQWVGQRVMFDLRTGLFNHLQRLSLRFFDKNPVGRLITRLTGDIDALNDLVTQGVVSILGDGVTIVFIVGIMIIINVKLALVGLAVLPVIAVAASYFQKAMRRIYRQIRVRLSRLNGYLNENITGMAIVQLFNREDKMFESFDALNSSYREANLKAIFAYSLFSPTVIFLSAMGT
ncbi:MAG TPA: ABC transporter ATP-binding protein, partial [Chloroflexota bacterium]|nr:ABC transporter ATP-binding protein [Chloroflexota bacterium]